MGFKIVCVAHLIAYVFMCVTAGMRASSVWDLLPASERPADLYSSCVPAALYPLPPLQPQLLLSPRETRTRDGSMFKFSPGCTTVFSPNKLSLGSSPR